MENKLNLTAENYNTFAILFSQFMKQTVSPHLDIAPQNNWHKSRPYYRINGYKGIQVSQSFGVYGVLNKEYLSRFSTIIEIGTYNGGLSLYVYDSKSPDCKFVTYDIDGTINHAKQKYTDIDMDCRVEDSFAESTFKDIVEMIQSDGKTLVLCDGGNKPREFNEFSSYLKSGDHIMLHDYSKTPEVWEFATMYWQWPYATDSSYESIEETIKKEKLEPFKHDEFEFVFWGSYVKP